MDELLEHCDRKIKVANNNNDVCTRLSDVAELDAAVDVAAVTITTVKKKAVRKKLPSDLPRETIIHDIKDKTCTCCGNNLHQMGEERSEKLEFIPAQVKMIEHVRLKYSCRA